MNCIYNGNYCFDHENICHSAEEVLDFSRSIEDKVLLVINIYFIFLNCITQISHAFRQIRL